MKQALRKFIFEIPFFYKSLIGLIILDFFGIIGIKNFIDPNIPSWVYGGILVLLNVVVVAEMMKEGTEIEFSLNPFKISIKKK